MKAILFAALFLSVLPAMGQAGDETQAKCKRYLHIPLPNEASTILAKERPRCDSTQLYTAVSIDLDYDAVGKCAWAERSANQNRDWTFGGSAMLAVLYANGEGVKRNIPLALRFACEENVDPGGIADRVKHLESLRDKPAAPDSKFRYCDDWQAGMVQRACASYSEDLAKQRRFRELYKLSSTWPERQQVALKALVNAEQSYVNAHTGSNSDGGELNKQGLYESTVNLAAEEDLLQDNFVLALQSFEKRVPPPRSAHDYAEADGTLNIVYRKVLESAKQKTPGEAGEATPQPQAEGIQKAERAWLGYRDEWLKFSALHYPKSDMNSWKTLLTNDRIAIVQNLSCDLADQLADAAAFTDGPCSGNSQDQETRYARLPLP